MNNGSIIENSKRGISIYMSAMFSLIFLESLLIPVFFEGDTFSKVVSVGVVLLLLTMAPFYKILNFRMVRGIKFNFFYYTALLFLGLSFLTVGIRFRILGYLAIAITLLVIIPIINVFASNVGKVNFIRYVTQGCLIAFIIFLIVSFVCGPALGAEQYKSFTRNPNIVGNFMNVVVASVLFLINIQANVKKKIALVFILCFAIDICFFSVSRTSLIAIATQLIIEIVYLFLRDKSFKLNYNNIKNFIVQLICVVAIAIVSFFSIFGLFTQVKSSIAKALPSIQIATEDESISLSDSLGKSETRLSKGLGNNAGNDAFTSGRMGIWQCYISKLNFQGHEKESMDIIAGERKYKDTNAHNVYLQIAYTSGILSGLAMCFISLTVFVVAIKEFIKSAVRRVWDESTLAYIFFAVGFGVMSITSAGYMMFTYLPATCFWIVNFVVMAKKKR